jgi:hypothetical protein
MKAAAKKNEKRAVGKSKRKLIVVEDDHEHGDPP